MNTLKQREVTLSLFLKALKPFSCRSLAAV
jgi:hypothetical protein